MTTTSRGKTTSRRRSHNSLGHFMLWALISWFLSKSHYRKTNNPFARPADRKPARRRKAAPKGGGGGGGGGGGAPRQQNRYAAPSAPKPAAPKKSPIYGPGGDDEVLAEVIDEVEDEDVELLDDEDEDDEVEGEVVSTYYGRTPIEAAPAAIGAGNE
jgi:hypothetical protein